MSDSNKMEKWYGNAIFIPFLGGCFHISRIESVVRVQVSLNVKEFVV